MKLKNLSIVAIVLLALAFTTAGFAGEKNKSDKKADTKSCCMQGTKASMTSDMKDGAKCPYMAGTKCTDASGKCTMDKGTKASLKSSGAKMSGKSKASAAKAKKAATTTAPAGTN